MNQEILISIIIPAFNEEAAIPDVIKKIKAVNFENAEIIVVDDGSTDNTAQVAALEDVRVVSHPYNIGNGAAVKTGIRTAKGRVLVFMDADGQHDPNDIPKLLSHIPQYHMVVGARSKDSDTEIHRDLANAVYNSFASFIAEFKIEDLTSGFRAMRAEDARRFCDMFPNTFSYPTTSTLAFIRSGRSLKYVSIKAAKRIGKSKIKIFHDGFEFLLIIMKIAVSFSPFRIFLPVSSFLFCLGIIRYIYTYFALGQFTNMSHLLINSSVIVFMLGLIAEQIASMRLEKGDRLFEIQDEARYEFLKQHTKN